MNLQLLFTLSLQVALVKSLREVFGYPGDTVTLLSKADPSWSLSSIVWSIFSNNTWIATFHNGNENVKWVDRYKGRLSLKTSSGDLTISNLTTEDEREYTVDLINTVGQPSGDKIKLTVRQRLQMPIIETVAYDSVKGGCWLGLRCSSAEKGVDLSWQGEPSSMTVFNMSNPDGNSAVLLAFLNTTQNSVKFNCTSSKNMEKASSVVTRKCEDNKPQPPPQSRERNAALLFSGGTLGGALTVIVLYFFGEQIKAKVAHLKGKMFPPTTDVVV
ncbi:CD48 antigen isoform X1 [Epinephelus lanceolatus]|uniref:SLAM family member 9 isoform X3 n=1 Tax=Epinephelus lanceolatus TaxID=310571 RepID=UPI0014471568|nr:SLAM family member 9 isoform X3 [Epinephelus lanceolatus]